MTIKKWEYDEGRGTWFTLRQDGTGRGGAGRRGAGDGGVSTVIAAHARSGRRYTPAAPPAIDRCQSIGDRPGPPPSSTRTNGGRHTDWAPLRLVQRPHDTGRDRRRPVHVPMVGATRTGPRSDWCRGHTIQTGTAAVQFTYQWWAPHGLGPAPAGTEAARYRPRTDGGQDGTPYQQELIECRETGWEMDGHLV